MSASPTNFLTVVSELLVVFLESGTVHVRGTIHIYGTVHVYDTIHVYNTVHIYGTVHEKLWERSKNFVVQSRE